MNRQCCKYTTIGLTAIAALLWLAPKAEAADEDIVSKMTAVRMERLIQSLDGVENFKELEDGIYGFELDGLKVIIFNKGESLLLYSGFDGRATLSRINEWNRTKRFTRAYADDDGEPCLESDIELTGGVTEKNIQEWIKTFSVGLMLFKKHLEE